MDMGKKIKLTRVEQGLSSGELADKAGIHISTLSKIENGENYRYNPPFSVITKIAEALEVSLDWLIDESQGYPPPERVGKRRERSRK